MNKLEKDIEELNINMGLDNYISKYNELKKNLTIEEKNFKIMEKKFSQETKKESSKYNNLSFDKITNKFEELISNIEEKQELESLIEYYKKAKNLKNSAQKKIEELQKKDSINMYNIN